MDAVPLLATLEMSSTTADVVVLGGGIAGLGVALFLADAGADVAVVETRDTAGAGFSGRGLGRVRSGLGHHAAHLAAEIGDAATIEILRFCAENAALWDALGLLDRCGSVAAAALPTEPALIEASLALHEAAGQPAEIWDASTTNRHLHSTGFGPALVAPADGVLVPGAGAALAEAAAAAGARLLTGTRAQTVDGEGLVHTTSGPIDADVVVHATNGLAADVDLWFVDKVFPVRAQVAATPPLAQRFPRAGTSQAGGFEWRQAPDGALFVSGCRHATLSMEVGERDDTVTSAAVEAMLRRVLDWHWPDLAEHPFVGRWSALMGHTCDGLPIVGPLPGRAKEIACVGFQGLEPSLALQAARTVADGLLTGRSAGVPRLFSPGRFV